MHWLKLLRITLLPSIIWDLVAGNALGHGSYQAGFFIALACGALIYHAGMIANDIADCDLDKIHRPQRPIASGAISMPSAFALLALFLGAALLLATQASDRVMDVAKVLVILVLIYNFGGSPIRRNIGPALLATARAGSLCLGVLASRDFAHLMSSPLLWAAASYAMYFLFLSRLACNEEEGANGMRILALSTTAACAPILILQQEIGLAGIAGSLWWAIYLLRPIIPLRHQFLSPSQVQLCVRRMLTAAPLLPAIALLNTGSYLLALGGPTTSILISALAKKIPPE